LSTIDPVRRPGLDGLLRALFEEAWRRARRRRLIYAGVVCSVAVIGVIVLGSLLSAPQSQSTSPAISAGPSPPVVALATGEHVVHGIFRCTGELGTFTVRVHFASSDRRSWSVVPANWPSGLGPTGQYARIAPGHEGGGGKRVQAGGHASEWYARLFGIVTPRRGVGARQRVVIELSGRPTGTFALIPSEPGVLKRDSGTQSSGFFG
jgi:hypothetical protein